MKGNNEVKEHFFLYSPLIFNTVFLGNHATKKLFSLQDMNFLFLRVVKSLYKTLECI